MCVLGIKTETLRVGSVERRHARKDMIDLNEIIHGIEKVHHSLLLGLAFSLDSFKIHGQ